MSLLQVDSGTEHLIPYAKKKIRELHDYMTMSGVASFAKRIDVSDGTAIYLNSLKVRDDLFVDKVRIVGGQQSYWVEQYPEQDLWSVASAVLPSIPAVPPSTTALLPWTGAIQHITYPYLTSDPRVYETKHQLVTCRYCKRVAEYTWLETAAYGTNLELGSAAVKVSSTDHSVTVHYGNPALTFTLIGELVPGSGAVDPSVPGRQIPVMIKRTDTVYTISTAEYDGIPDGDGGFFGGANYGRLVLRNDATGIVEIKPLQEGSQYAPVVLRRNVITTGEYHAHTITTVDLYDYLDNGRRTTRMFTHGVTVAATANPWGVLTDDIGPRPVYSAAVTGHNQATSVAVTYSGEFRFTTQIFENVFSLSLNGVVQSSSTEYVTVIGRELIVGGGDTQATISGGYWFGGQSWIAPGVYETSAALTAAGVASPPTIVALTASAAAKNAAEQPPWDRANIARARAIWEFVASEMDRKRFGAEIDLAELRPHSTYRANKIEVFPVRSKARFTWLFNPNGGIPTAETYGFYDWETSYRYPEFLNGLFNVSFLPPTEIAPTPAWSYTMEPPYVFAWVPTSIGPVPVMATTTPVLTAGYPDLAPMGSKVFTPLAERPAFGSVYFSLGTEGSNITGKNARAYFGLYFALGSAAKAASDAAFGVYTQAINNAQMKNVCIGTASLSYAAYSALYASTRGALYRRAPHTHVSEAFSVFQPQIDNTNIDPLSL